MVLAAGAACSERLAHSSARGPLLSWDHGPKVTTGQGFSMTAIAGKSDGSVICWCCGSSNPAESVVHLGDHPEVGVCLACAHFLHQRARQREDELHPSAGTRLRNALRAGRSEVIKRGWPDKPLLGGVLRWLGRRLP
jgi:hypothetical protein